MEPAKMNTFNCPIHQEYVINAICSNLQCSNLLCCIGCMLEDDCSHLNHKKQLMSIDNFIDYAALEYKSVERPKLGQEGPPKEFTDYILGEDESLQNLSKHIEEEKKLIEQTLINLMDAFQKICSKAKIAVFNALDQQFNNLRANHESYKTKLKKFYGDDNIPNPTKSDLVKKLNEAKDLHEYMKIFNEIQADFIDRVPADPNLLDKKIEDLKYKLNDFGQKIRDQQEMRPKPQFAIQKNGHIDFLEDFSKKLTEILENAFKLVNPISKVSDMPRLDTKILNLNEEILLESWVNPNHKFKFNLLYRATCDGFTANAFHAKVGSLKPTVVVIKSEFDKRFGGYSDIDWSVTNGYKQSNNTFLFSFDEKEIYPIKYGNQSTAICTNHIHGPTFGGGHDIHICNQSNVINSSYSNLNNSYDSKGKNCIHLAGAYNFKTKEIEVFQLI